APRRLQAFHLPRGLLLRLGGAFPAFPLHRRVFLLAPRRERCEKDRHHCNHRQVPPPHSHASSRLPVDGESRRRPIEQAHSTQSSDVLLETAGTPPLQSPHVSGCT